MGFIIPGAVAEKVILISLFILVMNFTKGDIAREKGMTQLSKETDITRDGLYKALSPTGNPSFDTVQKVVRAFGLKLNVSTL